MQTRPSLARRLIEALKARWVKEMEAQPPEAWAGWGVEDGERIEDNAEYGMISQNTRPDWVQEDYDGWEELVNFGPASRRG